MNRFIIIIFMLIPSCNFAQSDRILDGRSGVEIVFVAEADMFPDFWNKAPVNAKAASLNKKEIERSTNIIVKALSKYPSNLLKTNLKRIYILENVEFYGSVFGGTNSTNTVYLSNRGIKLGYTNRYLEQLFHAEFSSILLRRYHYHFNEKKWKAANSEDIKYGKSGVAALKTGKTSEHFDADLNEKGLLNQYALSKLENDFNAFAKNIFKSKAGFWHLCANYNRLEKKLKLIVAFYGKLDKSFTMAYFKEKSYE